MPYDNSTVRIDRRDDQKRVRELYQIAADACLAVIQKGENDLVSNYDQLFRDLALKQYNNETMFEYGWYGANSIDCRTGYVNGLPGSGESLTLGKPGSQMMAIRHSTSNSKTVTSAATCRSATTPSSSTRPVTHTA